MNYQALYEFFKDISQNLDLDVKFVHAKEDVRNLTVMDKAVYIFSTPFIATFSFTSGVLQMNKSWQTTFIIAMQDQPDSDMDQNDESKMQDSIRILSLTENVATKFVKYCNENLLTEALSDAADQLTILSGGRMTPAFRDSALQLTGQVLEMNLLVPDEFDYCCVDDTTYVLVSFTYTNNNQTNTADEILPLTAVMNPAAGNYKFYVDANDTIPNGLTLDEDTGLITPHPDSLASAAYEFDIIAVGFGNTTGRAAVRVTLTVQGPDVSTVLTLSGTLDNATESEVVTGGKTLIMTLSGTPNPSIWAATIGADNALTTGLIAGIVGSESGATIANALDFTNVVRTSDTVVTITLPAIAGYDIAANETISATIPANTQTNSVSIPQSLASTNSLTVTELTFVDPSSLSNLVLWYENTVQARSLWNTAGSQLNNSGTGPDGKLFSGSAYEFVTANEDHLNYGGQLSYLKDTREPFFADFWVKFNSAAGVQTIFSQEDGTENGFRGVICQLSSSKLVITYYNDGAARLRVDNDLTLSAGVWYHVQVIYDGSQTAAGISIDVNGNTATTVVADNVVQDVYTVNSNFSVGARDMAVSPELFLNGQIKDFVIKNAATITDDFYNNPQRFLEYAPNYDIAIPMAEKFQQKEGAVINYGSGNNLTFKSIAAGAYNPVVNGIEVGLQPALAGYNRYGAVVGTGTVSTSGTTVTGSGTSFTTQYAVNDVIVISGESRTVASITNNASLTVNSAFTTVSGKPHHRYRINDATNPTSIYGTAYNSANDLFANAIQAPFKNQILNLNDIINDTGINKLEAGNLGNVRTLVFLVKFPVASDQTIFETGAGTISLTTGAIVAAEFDAITVDGGANAITADTWHTVEITSDTDVNVTAFKVDEACVAQISPIGYSGTKKTASELADLRTYLQALKD